MPGRSIVVTLVILCALALAGAAGLVAAARSGAFDAPPPTIERRE